MTEFYFRSYYRQRPGRVTVSFTEPSLTQQHFRDECDVNHILRKARETGLLANPFGKAQAPQFGDFSDGFDFQAIQNTLARAQERFEALPSAVREEFSNSPAKLLRFVQDEKNYERALELGLVHERVAPQGVTAEGGEAHFEPRSEQAT